MRVLHATADWKWTGPAEPMLLLIEGLRRRGHEVDLACPEPPSSGLRSLSSEARKRGIEPRFGLSRGRGIRVFRDAPDARRMRAWLEEGDYEVVHTWHSRDHGLAVRAARRRRRVGATAIVRSIPGAEAPSRLPWNRWLLGPGCDGLLCVGRRNALRAALLRGGRPLAGPLGAVDSLRFQPAKDGQRPSPESFGVPPSARGHLVGVVARLQRHRRFDLLLDAFARLADQNPRAHLLILGRGTHEQEVVLQPVRDRGLADRVTLAGYREEDYVEALRCLDLLTFLVPGSDGTCRAILEAAGCGIPCVATRRGALPEIVIDGETGLLVDEDPRDLQRAWHTLLAQSPLRRRMGRAARLRAQEVFSADRLSRCVEELYEAS